MAQMATNVYKPKMASKLQINTYNNSYLPAQMATNMYKPKWQQICTSPNSLYINKFKPEASTELWEQQPSE